MALSDSDFGKRELERDHLGFFLKSYELATGETFSDLSDSETPDFVGRDSRCRTVGVEITQLRFSPEGRSVRNLFPPPPHDPAAWWHLLELLHRKEQMLPKGSWPSCERKILVIMLVDTTIDALVTGSATDSPRPGGFDEIWLADGAQIGIFGRVNLFPIVHPELKGLFDVASGDRKPYG